MIDIRKFYLNNVVDSCSVQSILSSTLLYDSSRSAKCQFCITSFVQYECVYKVAKHNTDSLEVIRNRLKQAQQKGYFKAYNIDIEDLQEVGLLQNKMKLSKGELSSMVFAKKTGQAFLTDDQNARKLAVMYIDQSRVQTTPHLAGWLVFISSLSDGDIIAVIDEHKKMNGTLGKHLHNAYMLALEQRLASMV